MKSHFEPNTLKEAYDDVGRLTLAYMDACLAYGADPSNKQLEEAARLACIEVEDAAKRYQDLLEGV